MFCVTVSRSLVFSDTRSTRVRIQMLGTISCDSPWLVSSTLLLRLRQDQIIWYANASSDVVTFSFFPFSCYGGFERSSHYALWSDGRQGQFGNCSLRGQVCSSHSLCNFISGFIPERSGNAAQRLRVKGDQGAPEEICWRENVPVSRWSPLGFYHGQGGISKSTVFRTHLKLLSRYLSRSVASDPVDGDRVRMRKAPRYHLQSEFRR